MICQHCNKKICNNGFVVLSNGKIYCEFCYEYFAFQCTDCNYKYDTDDCLMVNVDGKPCCKHCASKYAICNNCGIHTKDILNGLCLDCIINNKIQGYSYKPFPDFHQEKNENTNLFVGVELEINFNNKKDLANFIINANNDFFYYKHDGSLGNYGVEIVSHPATFNYHFHNEWKKIFDMLKNTNTDNCGLHFHLSKIGFDVAEIRMLDYFVNHYPSLISQIGSRALKGYCATVNSFYYGLERRNRHHTDACNLCNDKTIELRFCKSTSNYESFVRKMKMIFVLVTFVKMLAKYDYKQITNLDKTKMEKCFEEVKAEILSRI